MKAIIKGSKIYVGETEELIHWNDIPTNVSEIEEDTEDPYVVFVSATNSASLVGVMAWNQDNALYKACENFNIDPEDLLGVEELEF